MIWDEAFADFDGFVLVLTKDGKEYVGLVYKSATEGTPLQLLIKKPKQIIRENDGYTYKTEIEMGDSILFNENDISRVIFLKQAEEDKL